MNQGYFRHPSVSGDQVVFVCEDDLWTVPLAGGVSRRLTSGLGHVHRGILSPDGSLIAFTSTEEAHPEVWCMPADGGEPTRLTFLGANTTVTGWTPDGRVSFSSDHAQAFQPRERELYTVAADGGWIEALGLGPATAIAWAAGGAVALGRHTGDPARWKRYRGGTAGHLWIDRRGSGKFARVLRDIGGNLACPQWVGSRLYFISDHEGVGNVYSCAANGSGVQRHTSHGDYYARWLSGDGTTLVYQCGADLWRLDPASGDGPERIDIDHLSPRTQRRRKFVTAADELQGYHIHPAGHSIAVEARGRAFTMPLWENAAHQHGERDGVRYRCGQWLHDGETFVAVSDEGGEEGIDVFSPATAKRGETRHRLNIDIGRAREVVASPAAKLLAITNHRNELLLVNVDTGKVKELDHSSFGPIEDPSWSPDGTWVAYGHAADDRTMNIRVAKAAGGSPRDVTRAEFTDWSPTFSPDGRYLYFLSLRQFDPVYDHHFFDLGFPRGIKPMVVTLAADTGSPFDPEPKGFGDAPAEAKPDAAAAPAAKQAATAKTAGTPAAKTRKAAAKDAPAADGPAPVKIDFAGIEQRVLSVPMPDGRYARIRALKDKVLVSAFDIAGSLNRSWGPGDSSDGRLECLTLATGKHEVLATGISTFEIARDGATLVYRSGNRLRAVKAGVKPPDSGDVGREGGWLDLRRLRVSIDPVAEWEQMLREAWRLQRDHFWTADMSGVDWPAMLDRYLPLLDKVAARTEFGDLVWELQGELGTSHAYEMGGDHRDAPSYPIGHLGCDLEWDAKAKAYRIAHIVCGDSWREDATSPLAAPGLNIGVGDTLLGIAGQPVDASTSPQELLVNQAGLKVALRVGDARGKNAREVVTRTLRSEGKARYREWVEANRRLVRERTGGRAGYLHVPDMGPHGFSEFHRSLMSELRYPALVVDVRYNGGGHVSQLLLEKLQRRAIAWSQPRWRAPYTYPADSVLGPIVAITNEQAGSDGDIFSHAFKLLGLGPLVGMRTWGGVIGISPSHRLADGSVTTQPEYSFWFRDVGWGVENYGTDPDVEVEIAPQDHAAGRDPQMEKALDLVLKALKKTPPAMPDFTRDRPNLAVPELV